MDKNSREGAGVGASHLVLLPPSEKWFAHKWNEIGEVSGLVRLKIERLG